MKLHKQGFAFFRSFVVVFVGSFSFAVVSAQESLPYATSPVAGFLSGPGLSEVQRSAGLAIEIICPNLSAIRGDFASGGPGTDFPAVPKRRDLNAEETKFKVSCDDIWMNAADPVIPAGLQAIAAEETSAQGRTSIEAAGRNPINGRLFALRSGGGNIMLAGSSVKLNGQVLPLAQLLGAGSRGGGAAADSGLVSKWGSFINANYNTGHRDGSARENAFDFDDHGITGGVDYRFSDAFVGGIALSYSKTETDFKNSLGHTESKNTGVAAYASLAMGDWYVDGHAGYAKLDFDTARRILIALPVGIDTTATGSTSADQYTFNVGGGYDLRSGSVTFTPYARLDYLKLKVDSFTETEPLAGMALDINSRTVNSLQTAIGVKLWLPISTTSGVLTPYFDLEWNHEYDNDSGSVVAKFTNDPFNQFFTIPTDNPDRNFFTANVGMSTVCKNGVSAFVNLSGVFELAKTRNYGLTVGLRGEF